ncbi:DUF4244 domain-containing protein [Corynebacterium sp. H130]|uniref:DUF4244 domain-containing protein n=1 Tax=Corynebacterium sp. H130 TaxID=3133444 RepID=UPI0030A31B55
MFRTFIRDDQGMSTIEYAMGSIGAAALAGALYLVVKSQQVSQALQGILSSALASVPA